MLGCCFEDEAMWSLDEWVLNKEAHLLNRLNAELKGKRGPKTDS